MKYLDFLKDRLDNDEVFLKAKELYEGVAGDTDELILPKIRSITIKGIYPYKSDHEIRISSNKSNIIYGGNGAGKTTTINAIEFGLLGRNAEFEIKANFSNRVLNKFEISTILEIKGKKYLIHRSLTPNSESHTCSMRRISDTDLKTEFEKYESVTEVNALLNKLTGLSMNEYARIYDLFALRVPRRHYLASNIYNTPAPLYRQKIISKLLGHLHVVKIIGTSYKRWHQAKTSINRSKKNLDYFKSLTDIEVSQTNTEALNNFENDLNLVKNKIKDLSTQQDQLYKKYEENQTKEPKFNKYEELVEAQISLAKIEQIQEKEFMCEVCEADYSVLANQRQANGECPSCGSPDFTLQHKNYNNLREQVHHLKVLKQKYEQRREKYTIVQNKIIKEIRGIERELSSLRDKEKRLFQENTTLNPGRTHDMVLLTEDDIKRFEEEEKIFSQIYLVSSEFLQEVTRDFLSKFNEQFAYYQREIFDVSKWAMTSSYEIIADDGQEFKHLSHGEKNISDIIFRMALIDTLKQVNPELKLHLIIDTPEEGLDKAFHKRFQPILFEFVKQHQDTTLHVLTSCEQEFVDSLDKNFFRLENLLEKSSNSRPFQIKQLKLVQFLS